jgi:DNA-binding transcriptional ArsR family regulator
MLVPWRGRSREEHVQTPADIIRDVSQSPPPLLPIFRSAGQLAVLAELFTGRASELSVGELSTRTGVPQATVSREVSRLVAAGILADREIGRTRLIRADTESAIHGELEALLIKVAGPPAVLSELLGPVPDIAQAYIYGSWARRHRGEPGAEPGDIDVLLVATGTDATATTRLAREVADVATERLGREVSITVLTPAEWESSTSGFVRGIRDTPLVPIDLSRPS